MEAQALMHRSRILMFAALVALLAGAVVWQVGREERGDWDATEALFPGLDANRVRRIRFENAERHFSVELERDAAGRWTMVEPIEYPADPSLPTYLLQAAEQNQLDPVASEERNAAALGLDPPRATIEFVEDAGGEERVHTVELGTLDADLQRVGARADGRLGRTRRNLMTTLDRSFLDFRDARILPDLEPRNVIEVHRSGLFTYSGGERADLSLDALYDSGLWRMTTPWNARLDPGGMGYLIANALDLRAEGFVDEERSLASMGLDAPWVRLEFVALSGRIDVLEIGFSEDGGWHARREGAPWFWRIREQAVLLFSAQPGVWIDLRLVRAARPDLVGLRLLRDGRELLFERDKERWTVRERAIGEDGGSVRAADPRAVADLLGAIEVAGYGRVAFDVDVATIGDGHGFDLLLAHEVQGVRFGEPTALDGGGDRAVPAVRTGETIAGWLDPAFVDELAVELADVLGKSLLEGVEEFRTQRLVVEGAGRKRTFEREGTGTWFEEGREIPTRELEGVLDPIFFLRAERHLPDPPGADGALGEPITVTIEHERGRARFTIGTSARVPEGFEIEADGGRSVPAVPDLHEKLAQLVRG